MRSVRRPLSRTLAAAGLALAVAASPLALAAPKVGIAAPAFQGPTTTGETVALTDLRGRTVILEWTNHDCPYVRKHYSADNMQQLQKMAVAGGKVWLTVISSAPGTQGHVEGPQAQEIAASRNASPSEIVLDPAGDIGRMYGARTTPHMYIVDPAGNLVYMGGIDDKPTADPADIPTATNYVRAALDELEAGKPVSQPVTRAYGCSVKYAS